MAKDTSLIAYQLSDNSGEFSFNNLPIGSWLIIRVYYTGYQSLSKPFIIPDQKATVDLKQINLYRSENVLEEVVVKSTPPVRMNGDTLEFSAAAFKLDKNAVAEDLLRGLPGITVWSDGSITVNGRKVSQVLVDGKPFFGKDARIATQNITKMAIDKVQVYQQRQDLYNPLDSITEINIKLKKGKNFGNFGKASAGYDGNHYDIDVSQNFFTPHTQVGIIGAANNINKITKDANTLLVNSTYKKNGVITDYQTNADLVGINKYKAGGIVFQQDFIPDPSYYKNNRLSGNYFFSSTDNRTSGNTTTVNLIGNNNILTQKNASGTSSSDRIHQADVQYNKKKNNNVFYIISKAAFINSGNISEMNSSIVNKAENLLSTNYVDSYGNENRKQFSIKTGISLRKSNYDESRQPGDWDIIYSLDLNNGINHQLKKASFISVVTPVQNQSFDRDYFKQSDSLKQHLFISFGDLSKWLIGYSNILNGVTIRIQNHLYITSQRENNNASDFDIATGLYLKNTKVSAINHFTTIDNRPTLQLSKSILKLFGLRYSKTFLINLNIQEQFNIFKNTSDHSFQNISYSYSRFTPSSDITYTNHQFGNYHDVYKLDFKLSSEYAPINQLAPLVDSSNLYYIRQGNIHLKPVDHKQLNFSFQHTSLRSKNSFGYNINITAGIDKNAFVDSIMTDSLGRSTYYFINADGKKYMAISGKITKAFLFNKNNQLQIEFLSAFNSSIVPNYINGLRNTSVTYSFLNDLTTSYSYKDLMFVHFRQKLYQYRSRQTINNNLFKTTVGITTLGISVNASNKLNIKTDLTYNNVYSTVAATRDFTIWNANASYRFLPGNNLELAFSAFDLLRQNKGYINFGSNNTLTTGTINVLQQYFMLSLSYYFRKFGK
jgi:hypothetical protein